MSHRLSDIANLTTLYSAPGRYYHNLDHINFCLGQLEVCDEPLKLNDEERDLLHYAIWWHDAIYNPYSKKNEANSVRLFLNEVNLDIHPYGFGHKVEDIIMATAHHTEDQENLSRAAQIMLDIDLAGLGLDLDDFKKNGENIRKEFAFVSDNDFAVGRAKFWIELLQRKQIYYTEYFHSKYEKWARSNILMDLFDLAAINFGITRLDGYKEVTKF